MVHRSHETAVNLRETLGMRADPGLAKAIEAESALRHRMERGDFHDPSDYLHAQNKLGRGKDSCVNE